MHGEYYRLEWQYNKLCLSLLGVEILPNGTALAADLVIEASGPRSCMSSWLKEGGYTAPHTVKVDPHIGYTFSILDVPKEVRQHQGMGYPLCL